jgi:hypothetical protein
VADSPILNAIADQPVRDAATGQWVKGRSGKPKGAVSKFTREMKLVAAQMMAEGDPNTHNPLVVCLRIMSNVENDPNLRLRAADVISKYVFPTKQTIEIEAPDPVDEDRIEKTKRLLTGLVAEIVEAHDRQA